MKEALGERSGKRDRIIRFLNRKRKEKKINEELTKKIEKDLQKEEEKKKNILLIKDTTPVVKDTNIKPEKDIPVFEDSTKQEELINNIKKEAPVNGRKAVGRNRDNNVNITNFPIISKVNENISESKNNENKVQFIERQIIKVLEQDIEDKNFELKKVDSQIHTIQKNFDKVENKEELEELENEIEELMKLIEKIKKQIRSLEKTFDGKLPIEEPDNYLIYLVDEYKKDHKYEKDFYKKLKDKKEYISLIDMLVDIENKNEMLTEKINDKKEEFSIDEEELEKLNEDIVDIEEIKENISKLFDLNKNLMADIELKVNETVEITERVQYISKSVSHSMLELFLLMATFKHNLSMKNNAVAAATAALTLDMIIKMTTPTKEKIVTKDNNLKDYKNMINDCIKDTDFLSKTINNNLKQITDIRYTFEHEYSSCSYLPSYQEALSKLTSLESDMIQRKKDVARMKKDVELQLEKNNAKVKKYGVA